jgi:hypothetical protein
MSITERAAEPDKDEIQARHDEQYLAARAHAGE